MISQRVNGGRHLEDETLSETDLKRIAALGEGLHLEFKRRVPEGSRVAKEVTALANTYGGQVLIGVSDEGEVLGVRDADEEVFSLRNALEAHCDPPVGHFVRRVPISRRRDVILVDVPESARKPHYVVEEEEERRQAYVRVADMSIEASREAVRLMRTRATQRNVRFEFGDKELKLMRYLEEYGRISVEQFSRLAGVKRRSASQTLVLLARARILSFHPDTRQDYFTLAANGAR